MAIKLIGKDVFWVEDCQLMILWPLISRYNLFLYPESCMALLILARHKQIQNRLCVIKNRAIDLVSQKTLLDSAFDEYTLVDDGWRGSIQLSESEMFKWQLMMGSN